MADDDEARQLAEDIASLTVEELAERIRDKLDDQAREALRNLVHPETGERLSIKGVQAVRPPRHETGSLEKD